MPAGGIISHLTAKCGDNIHDRGVVEIAASSVSGTQYPRNAADLESETLFQSESIPGQWICLDFKTLRIEPTHYTIRTGYLCHLKSWAVEGSDDGAPWTEIDWRENNSDLNDERAVKTFVISQSGSFGWIHLRQTGPNHGDNNCLVLGAFEVLGAVVGLLDDFVKFCFLTAPVFPFRWTPFNVVISGLTARTKGLCSSHPRKAGFRNNRSNQRPGCQRGRLRLLVWKARSEERVLTFRIEQSLIWDEGAQE
jgi:hypothetical protein